MSDLVIREVARNIWTFSRPFNVGFVKLGSRSTAIKLSSGNVWVGASTPLCAETKAKLDEIGPVKYIVAFNAYHNLYLDAKLCVPEPTIERVRDKTLTYDGAWGRDSPNTKCGFEDEIQACYLSGFKNKEVAFFHAASKSLIEADVVLNLPATEQYSKSNQSAWFPLVRFLGQPYSWLSVQFSPLRVSDSAAMRRDATTVANWEFTRIIPCHGDVIDKNANQIWRRRWAKFID